MIKGAVAGAIGTWVMGQVTTFLWNHEDSRARERYQAVTGGQYVPDRTAEKLETLFGLDLSPEQHEQLAEASHWTLGAGTSVGYALLRHRFAAAAWGQGLGFGIAFWALVDEGMTPLLGLARPPQDYPWQAHARGLVGHLVYGVVVDTMLGLLDRIT
ncbi:MAG: hypothetical protein NVS2B7_17900 [Herpetosiphon sp.]